MVLNSKIRAGMLATLFGVLTIALVSSYLVSRSTQKTLDELAADTAFHWAEYLAANLPGIQNITLGHAPSWLAREVLERTQTVGDIFRYKIFDAQGELVLVSDNPYFRFDDNTNLLEHNPLAGQVITTGEAFIDVRQGDGESRPEHYSEAYVPITINDQMMGIIEVYIDQTHLRPSLITALREISLLTFLAMIAAFGIPALGFLWLTHLHDKATTDLNHASHHDGLTGASNRISFNFKVEDMITAGHDVTVHALDFDHFKTINEKHGHHVGDDILRQAGRRLEKLIGEHAIIGRPSGDEFAICQPHSSPLGDDQHSLALSIRETISEPFQVDGLTITCHCSIGFASTPHDGDTAAELVQRASIALDEAKLDGRNKAIRYENAMDKRRQNRLELQELLRTALADELFTLNYQPQFDAHSSKLMGFEALVRLNDPSGKPIGPHEFIPVAEEMGLINALGEWVLRKACGFAALWPTDITVAVNLSAIQFEDGKLVDTVKSVLAETELPGHQLELEITESLLIDDTDNVIKQLHELRALGIKIALDDFGTGYSCLSYLWKFPFDRLKIDRSFVMQIEQNEGKAYDILLSIVSLAHALNLEITAEGVETQKQLDILKAMGQLQLQGFLLGRPMPEIDVPALIMAQAKPLIHKSLIQKPLVHEPSVHGALIHEPLVHEPSVQKKTQAEIANRVSLIS